MKEERGAGSKEMDRETGEGAKREMDSGEGREGGGKRVWGGGGHTN